MSVSFAYRLGLWLAAVLGFLGAKYIFTMSDVGIQLLMVVVGYFVMESVVFLFTDIYQIRGRKK